MIMSEKLIRFIQMLLNQIEWNELKLVVVENHEGSSLARITVGDWKKDFDKGICAELYVWLERHNDQVQKLGDNKLLVTEFIGPSYDFRFYAMMIFVVSFPDK